MTIFRKSATLAVVLTLAAAQGAAAQTSTTAPWKALTSPEAALKVVFEEVCLPAMLDGVPVKTLARARHMVAMNPKVIGGGPDDRVWRLASLGDVYVVLWADGTCSSSVERGDPQALTAQVLAAASARGLKMSAGAVDVPERGGSRQAWCSDERPPFVIAITRKVGRERRPAILTTAFRAKASPPSFCEADG